MSPSTMFIVVMLLNVLTMNYAYRIHANDEQKNIESLLHLYKDAPDDEERLANLPNLQQTEEFDSDKYYILCHPRSLSILCNRLDNLSRRDTGFLRFGRKR